MEDCDAIVAAVDTDDPRLSREHLRCLDGDDAGGSVLLVGVVHDHPASTFRVGHVLDRVTPSVLALELPPLAMPIFRQYARDASTPPRLGGEMSMALQAAGDVRSVGIDVPNRTYLRLLVRRVRTGRIPRSRLRAVLKDFVSASGHALVCRFGALLGRFTRHRLRVYSHIRYDSTFLDPPAVQAEHETRHLAQQRAFLRAVEVPLVRRLIDETREESMARQLRDLRLAGDVVAVVGMEHLDPLCDRLEADP